MDDTGYFLAVYNETLRLRAERQLILSAVKTERERAQRVRLEIQAIRDSQIAPREAQPV
ncbi:MULTISPECIES: hypothetical protein [unclassified Mesorhizobium]|uniref:hypothetical protein n=1 Tax=unclassified Mesorhizobium TaxID=325217 RepID=UPI001481DF6D|nr:MULTISPECIES: hypothetical protein [unclassified Mesorhizobium]